MQIFVPTTPCSVSVSFSLRLAMPIWLVPLIASLTPLEESEELIMIVTSLSFSYSAASSFMSGVIEEEPEILMVTFSAVPPQAANAVAAKTPQSNTANAFLIFFIFFSFFSVTVIMIKLICKIRRTNL